MDINFRKLGGTPRGQVNPPRGQVNLVPTVVQDSGTNQVLMVGFMNKKAYQKTVKTGRVTFYSRSKKRLWTKGEASKNYLEVVSITPDCDKDTLLIKANPKGSTCHTGQYSCFKETRQQNLAFLSSLYSIIELRKKIMPKNSYTASLFKKGVVAICNKIEEESCEVVKAVCFEGQKRTIEEISDLVYHIMVLMAVKEISWKDIIRCLRARGSCRKQD